MKKPFPFSLFHPYLQRASNQRVNSNLLLSSRQSNVSEPNRALVSLDPVHRPWFCSFTLLLGLAILAGEGSVLPKGAQGALWSIPSHLRVTTLHVRVQ